MRCALVHDWLTGMRGGEKVLELLCEIFPDADLYTMFHVPGSVSPLIERRRIFTSSLNALPQVGAYYRNLLPLLPLAAGSMRLSGYDLVVATSHCVAQGVRVEPGTRFVSYCFTPMRYAWQTLGGYRQRLDSRWDFRYAGLRLLSRRLRDWDRRAAERVTEFVTSAVNVQKRIRRCYGRDAAVIFPPVDTDYYCPQPVPAGDFYLWAGALAPYKRIDLALEAFRKLGRKLVVIGDGQEMRRARKSAPPGVTFLGRQPDDVLRRHYSACRALVFPGEEDFGIVPLEAQACGRPVIAYGKGGALETVVDLDAAAPGRSPTGVLFGEASADGLAEAVLRFERNKGRFRSEAMRAHAMRFSTDRCREHLQRYLLRENGDGATC